MSKRPQVVSTVAVRRSPRCTVWGGRLSSRCLGGGLATCSHPAGRSTPVVDDPPPPHPARAAVIPARATRRGALRGIGAAAYSPHVAPPPPAAFGFTRNIATN